MDRRALLLACAAASAGLAGPAAAQQPYPLDTLHVTVGSRADPRLPAATRSVDVITAEEIRRLPARTLADVLGWALGVDVQARSPAQADVGLRGSGPEQVLVLVDGMRATDPQTAHFALDQAAPLDDIDRIEVLRGPASALYGADAVGGVINIVTRGAAAGSSGRVEAGSFGTAAVRFRLGGSTASTAPGGAKGDPGPAGLAGALAGELERSDGWRPGTDDRAGSLRGSASAGVAGRVLRVDGGFLARDFGARAFYTPPAAPFDEYEKTRTSTLAVSWLPADPSTGWTPRLSVRRHDDDFVLRRNDPSFYRNVHRSLQLGGEVDARRGLGWGRLAAGGEAYRDLLRSTNLGDRDEGRAAAFAELSAGDAASSALEAGARLDWHSRFGTFLAPSLSGSTHLAPPLRLRASAGRAFRAPTWTERYYIDPSNVGNPGLRPERAWEAEVGADWSPGDAARFSATGFLRRTGNLIDWIARPGTSGAATVWDARNLGVVRFRGAELEGMGMDPLGTRWALRASALTFDADTAAAASKYALRPLIRTASLTADRGVFRSFGAGARIAWARRAGQGAGYWLLDARLRAAWRAAELSLDGRNLGGASYLDVTGIKAAGRAVYVGFGWMP